MAKDLREEKGEDLRGRRSGGKGLRGERGEMISTGKGVEKILGRKGRRSGGKKANRDRGEKILGRKSEKLSAGERPWEGKGGKDLREERGGKILGSSSLRASPPPLSSLRSFPPFPSQGLSPAESFSLFLPKIFSPLSLLALFPQIFSLSSRRSFPPLALLRSFLPFPP